MKDEYNQMDTNDFSDIPQSISEIRASKERNGSLWTARDALIDTLRCIDKGEADPAEMFIAYHDKKSGETRYVAAAGSMKEIVGTTHCALNLLMNGSD